MLRSRLAVNGIALMGLPCLGATARRDDVAPRRGGGSLGDDVLINAYDVMINCDD